MPATDSLIDHYLPATIDNQQRRSTIYDLRFAISDRRDIDQNS